jgi:ferredoxin
MKVIEDFVHPSTYTANTPGKKSSFAADTQKYLEQWAELGKVKPLYDAALCNQCKECLSACPSGAISIEPQPRIDPEKCLSCFCCVEVCPEKVFVLPIQELQEKWERMSV